MAVIIAFDTEDPSIPHLYVAGKDRQTIFGLTNDGKQFAHLKLGASVELTLDQARQIGEPYLDEVLSNIERRALDYWTLWPVHLAQKTAQNA